MITSWIGGFAGAELGAAGGAAIGTAILPGIGTVVGGAIGAVLIFVESPVKALIFIIFIYSNCSSSHLVTRNITSNKASHY